MRPVLLLLLLSFTFTSSAQYYYKDVVGTAETSSMIRNYIKNRVSRVTINSYDAENVRSDAFQIEQQFSAAEKMLRTITRTKTGGESVLVSYIDAAGNVIKTIDSSNLVISTTTYNYGPSGELLSVINTSSDSAGTLSRGEEHIWKWVNNKPVSMVRIKNRVDTAIVSFTLDENGNVTEERETRKGVTASPIYYYYNEENQLTDVVRFNSRAGRLLPELMFEYSPSNQVIQKITVPINNPDYVIWRYQYNPQGLKVKEAIYDKYKVLSGKVEYQYSFE